MPARSHLHDREHLLELSLELDITLQDQHVRQELGDVRRQRQLRERLHEIHGQKHGDTKTRERRDRA